MHLWPTQREAASFYGDPDPNGDGVPDRAWEDANLERLKPPFTMVLAWDVSKPLSAIRVHQKCASSLGRVLGVILAHYLTQEGIEKHRLHLYGGAYNFRAMRGSTRLSMHSYGCAIDIDPENNPLGRPWRLGVGMIPEFVIEAFEAEEWIWGGRWSRPDPQHFQAARVS